MLVRFRAPCGGKVLLDPSDVAVAEPGNGGLVVYLAHLRSTVTIASDEAKRLQRKVNERRQQLLLS